ncbi:MAG: hypothetical protein JWO79_480 [Actinomycetia bacterium]|jgi:hypothetical protein|nr:hypothetical protein [Actinomycetes bacterium]
MSRLFSPLTPRGTPIRDRAWRQTRRPAWPLLTAPVPGDDVAWPPQHPRARWAHDTGPRPPADRDEAVPP